MTTRNSGVVGVSGNSNVKRSSTENPFTQKNRDQICANVLIPHAHCRQLQQLGCLHYFIISQCIQAISVLTAVFPGELGPAASWLIPSRDLLLRCSGRQHVLWRLAEQVSTKRVSFRSSIHQCQRTERVNTKHQT